MKRLPPKEGGIDAVECPSWNAGTAEMRAAFLLEARLASSTENQRLKSLERQQGSMTGQQVLVRCKFLIVALSVVALGLLSRRVLPPSTFWIGDILWAVVLYLLSSFVVPTVDRLRLAMYVYGVATLVETSHLIQSPIVISFSKTLAGRLLIGRGFSGIDLGMYALGIGLGIALRTILESSAALAVTCPEPSNEDFTASKERF